MEFPSAFNTLRLSINGYRNPRSVPVDTAEAFCTIDIVHWKIFFPFHSKLLIVSNSQCLNTRWSVYSWTHFLFLLLSSFQFYCHAARGMIESIPFHPIHPSHMLHNHGVSTDVLSTLERMNFTKNKFKSNDFPPCNSTTKTGVRKRVWSLRIKLIRFLERCRTNKRRNSRQRLANQGLPTMVTEPRTITPGIPEFIIGCSLSFHPLTRSVAPSPSPFAPCPHTDGARPHEYKDVRFVHTFPSSSRRRNDPPSPTVFVNH